MKAAYIESFATHGNVKVGHLQEPKPEENEVCIAVEYAGVNPVDAKIAEGLLQTRMPHRFPIILGWDASGTIHSFGRNVKGWSLGDKVYAYCRKPVIQYGSFAEYITLPAENVALIPQNLTLLEAASIPLSGLTAWQSLFEKAQLKPDETVLIHGGAGGVGSFAIQWAKFSDSLVITTVKEEKKEYVKHLGADEIIDYEKTDFVKHIREIHPFGIEVVFDTIGKTIYTRSFEVLRQGGRIVSLLEQPNLALAEKFQVKAEYHFVEPSGHELREIAQLFEHGKAIVPKIEVMDLDDAAKAIDLIRQGHTTGKIVLKIQS